MRPHTLTAANLPNESRVCQPIFPELSLRQSRPPMPHPKHAIHTVWEETCAATAGIRLSFGLESALRYGIRQKLFQLLFLSERDSYYSEETDWFVAQLRRIFSKEELAEYISLLQKTEFKRRPTINPDRQLSALAWIERKAKINEYRRYEQVRDLLLR